MTRTDTPPHTPAQALTVHTLGRFAVYRGDALIAEADWRRQKAKKLFKLLLLAPQRQMLKDQLLELLWPALPPEMAANNLHRTLFILRRVLQPDVDRAAHSHYLWFKDEMLGLHPSMIAWVDVEEFDQLLQLGRQRNHDAECYTAALTLYGGEFLPDDVHEDWFEARRRTLQQHYIDLLKRLSAIAIACGDQERAIEYLCTLLRVEPSDEGAQRELMGLYARTGARHRALRLYQRSRQVMLADLGVTPSARTTAVYEAILRDHFPPPDAVSPAATDRAALPAIDEPHRTPLVGREAEVRQLADYLQQAHRGHGSVIFLIGEQGVGKTRICEDFAAYARTLGTRTQYGAAYEGEGRLPYAPFVEAMRKGLTPQLLGRVRQRLGPLIDDLARLLPEVAVNVPSIPGRAAPVNDRLAIDTSTGQRRRLFDAVAITYAMLAEQRPLLAVLDNLHAAGEASLQLLHYLARWIGQHRVLLICTVDQDRLQRGAPITLLLGELQRNHLAQRLQIGRLPEDDVARLCIHLLDQSVLQSQIPATVYNLTEGNPFLVKELVLSLVRMGKIERRDGCWQLLPEAATIVPASVLEIIGVRLGHLSAEAYRLIGAAAVIGNGFNYTLLQTVLEGRPEGEPGDLLDTFDQLLEERLIEVTETGYGFQHAMIRQAVYEALTPERRAWLHERVARAIEATTVERLDEQAAILAFHYEHAGDLTAACRYLLRAGDWARGAYAMREALEHYDHACRLHRLHLERAEVATLIGLLERRSLAYLALSDFDSAIGDLEELLRVYGERGLEARAGETLYQIGFAHYWAHRLAKAAAYLDRALTAADALDYRELRTRVQRLRDILHSTQGRVVEGTVDLGTPHDGHSDATNAEEYWGHAMLAHLRGDAASALRHAQSCIEVGRSINHTFLTLGGHFVLAMSHANLGDYQRAMDSLQGALKLSDASGDRFWRARLFNTLGWIYRELLQLDDALRCDHASLDLARASTPRLTEAEGNALANLATTNLLLGEHAAAHSYLHEGLALATGEPFMSWRYATRLTVVEGWLALADGRTAAALAAADKALDLAKKTTVGKNRARAYLLRGSALLAQGETDGARKAINDAAQIAQELQLLGLAWSALLALADLEERAGQPDAAQIQYDAARDIVERIADRLTDASLRDRFLDAASVRGLRTRGQAPLVIAPGKGAHGHADLRIPM